MLRIFYDVSRDFSNEILSSCLSILYIGSEIFTSGISIHSNVISTSQLAGPESLSNASKSKARISKLAFSSDTNTRLSALFLGRPCYLSELPGCLPERPGCLLYHGIHLGYW